MADPVRVRRVAEQIRGELSQILRDEVRDPRLGLITITRVKLAVDLGAATVFYSPLGEDADAARQTELSRVMTKLTGFLRRALSKRVKLRHTPELRFVFDDSIAEGAQTLGLIRELGIEREAAADVDSEDDSEGNGSDEDGQA